MKSVTLIVLFMSLFCRVCTARADPLPNFPFLTVTEEAKLLVKPDMATLTFYIKNDHEKSEVAVANVNKTSLALITFFKKYHVKNTDIKSYDISKRVMYNRNQQNNVPKRYEVSQYFEVTLKPLDNYQVIVKKLLETDDLQQFQSRFDVTNRQKLEFELIQQAGANARVSADNLAASVGVSVLSVFAINKDSNFNQFFATFGFNQQGYAAAMRSAEATHTSVFLPEHINVSARVNVVYKISQQ